MADHTFSVKEAAALLDLTPSEVRSFARAGLGDTGGAATGDVARESRFGFRDLVVLRMAAGLRRARIPSRRIERALAGIRRTTGREVAGLRLEALGDHVVVRDGEVVWRADSGQLDLGLVERGPVGPELGAHPDGPADFGGAGLRVIPREADAASAQECLARAQSLEEEEPEEAAEWYGRSIECDPGQWEAHVGLGFLRQQLGRPAEAVESYEHASTLQADATVSFNLGVALDDLGRVEEAEAAYREALEIDPSLADAHFNLSCLYEKSGDRTRALRHMIACREQTSD